MGLGVCGGHRGSLRYGCACRAAFGRDDTSLEGMEGGGSGSGRGVRLGRVGEISSLPLGGVCETGVVQVVAGAGLVPGLHERCRAFPARGIAGCANFGQGGSISGGVTWKSAVCGWWGRCFLNRVRGVSCSLKGGSAESPHFQRKRLLLRFCLFLEGVVLEAFAAQGLGWQAKRVCCRYAGPGRAGGEIPALHALGVAFHRRKRLRGRGLSP